MTAMQAPWDIFCRVIDNYGDIGVCWRLARQLATEYRLPIRLWVDDLPCLTALHPGVVPDANVQRIDGVHVCQWPENFPDTHPAAVVIEAFACDLPDRYLQSMARRDPPPCWINLEYLSAEPWVETCHGLASPHPNLPCTKYFFFPGFGQNTGGLLREDGIFAQRDAYLGRQTQSDHLEISLFCYETAPLGPLLDLWGQGARKIRCYVPPGKPLAAVRTCLGGNGPWRRRHLEVLPVPFLPMEEYDRLLWRCDINFVRGEDSLVRAIWAGKPFIWHIYPQDGNAHLAKLDAFLRRYTASLDQHLGERIQRVFHAWNGSGNLADEWPAFADDLDRLRTHTLDWGRHLAGATDLAASLVKFCANRL